MKKIVFVIIIVTISIKCFGENNPFDNWNEAKHNYYYPDSIINNDPNNKYYDGYPNVDFINKEISIKGENGKYEQTKAFKVIFSDWSDYYFFKQGWNYNNKNGSDYITIEKTKIDGSLGVLYGKITPSISDNEIKPIVEVLNLHEEGFTITKYQIQGNEKDYESKTTWVEGQEVTLYKKKNIKTPNSEISNKKQKTKKLLEFTTTLVNNDSITLYKLNSGIKEMKKFINDSSIYVIKKLQNDLKYENIVENKVNREKKLISEKHKDISKFTNVLINNDTTKPYGLISVIKEIKKNKNIDSSNIVKEITSEIKYKEIAEIANIEKEYDKFEVDTITKIDEMEEDGEIYRPIIVAKINAERAVIINNVNIAFNKIVAIFATSNLTILEMILISTNIILIICFALFYNSYRKIRKKINDEYLKRFFLK